ncbi:hypothetical protein U1Q18_029698 [Sarracenia purpurea var. burkii]
MERDFLGLNAKDSGVVVKEEAVEGCKDSEFEAFSKASGVQWPLSNKVSALQNFMSFKDAEEYKNFAGATMKQQLLGGIPVTAPHSVLPSLGSVTGTTVPCFNSKSSGAPDQLTIFYAGKVHVFEDISPEQAQAIMLLAVYGSSIASDMAQPRAQVQVPSAKQPGGDGGVINQLAITPPSSVLSSPMSVSSHPVSQSGGGSPTNYEAKAFVPTVVSSTPVSKVDAPKIVTSLGPLAATTMVPSAAPQARKASLARFLEKRKERAMSSAPYNPGKIYPECATPGSNSATHSVNTGSGAGASLEQQGE